MKPARYFDWNVHEKWATFHTRDPLDPKMVEKIKELPGVDSVVQPHLRYSLTLYKGMLFEWKEIEDSIEALFKEPEQADDKATRSILIEPGQNSYRASVDVPYSLPCVAYAASPSEAVALLRELFPKQTNGIKVGPLEVKK